MAYIGSLPFTIEARTECSVLLRSGNHLPTTSSFFAYSPRKSLVCAGLSDPPIECSKVAVLRGCSESWTWRIKRATPESMCGAVGRNSSGGEETEELEDTFEATIEKSKRSLALQRDLLQQIAEKRKQVSSIISSTIESEDSGAYKEEETYIPNLDLASTSNNNSEEQHDGDILSSSHLHSTTVEMPEGLPSVTGTGLREEKKQVERSLTPDKLFSMSNRMSDKFPSFLSSSSETTHVKYGEGEELREPALQMSSEVNDPASEDIKPPPLAGANVMNVILVTAECAPWSKTGGLGDVAGALPKALARRGHRMMVVAPRYGNYAEPKDTGVRNLYRVDGQDVEVTYLHAYIDDVDFVFIDCHMFRHMENDIYGGNRVDILKRMILFCKVAVEVPWHVPCGGVCYGDGNLVFIANDWHTALLPVYLKAYYHDRGLMKYARSVLVIHNIAHQGRGPLHDFFYADLPEHYIDLFKLYDPLGGEHFNIFAAGIKAASRVVTVSHGYAWELKTAEGGWGLHNIINENNWKLKGIVNGIDAKEWSPQHDVHLASDGYANFSADTLSTGKPKCKAALQKELGLPLCENVPLIGFIGRLDHQKGVDILAEAIPWMIGQDVQLVMLGVGRNDLEQLLRKFENQHHDKIRGWVGFSVRTAHRIIAGADILLMPSRFEPCGLNQLYAMSYGTVPVVHAVGGLRDTVQPFDPYNEMGVGWTFDKAEANKLIHALGNCLLTYHRYKKSWEGIQRRGMMQDLSWDHAAKNYEEVLIAAKYQW